MNSKGNEIKQINFGNIPLNRKSKEKLFIVNNSMTETNYQIFIVEGISPDFKEQGNIM